MENLEKLIKGLQQTNPAKRERAIKQLCDFCMTNPGHSQQAIPTLNSLLMEKDIKISSYTAQTLIRVGKHNVSLLVNTVPQMADFVNFAYSQMSNYKGSWQTVGEVIETLGEIGAYAPDKTVTAIPVIYKGLNPPVYHPMNFLPGMEKVYAGSAHALGLLSSHSSNYIKESVPTLFKIMVETYTYPRLIEDARNRNGVRWWVIYSIMEIGKASPAYVIPTLVKALTNPNMEVRKKVIEILDTVANDPRSAVPSLVQCVNSMDAELSKNAALTLGSLGQNTPEFVIPSLISLLQSQNPNILKNTLTVVNSIAKTSPQSVLDVKEYLISALNNQDNEVRLLSIRIFYLLSQTNPMFAQETIPFLIYINMNDPSQAVKDEAVVLLNHLKVDIEKYTLTIEILRQTQEMVVQIQNEGKDSSKVMGVLQESKDALIELNYEAAQEKANQAYVVASSLLPEQQSPPTQEQQAPTPTQEIKRKVEEKTEQATLLSEYDFETFVKGPSNSFSLAASMAVAENPSQAYNPLFIYSGPGLGKTHLLNAIGNHYKKLNPLSSVIYITSEKFTNELINSIQNNTLEEFRNRYRNVDILLIDDIHSIAGKERTQEEFFNTFNSLYNNKKQIVLSSDRPPSEIPTLEERLRSRFEWGLITEMGPPDFETRVAILKSKAQSQNVTVPEDVLNIIANKESASIRKLEGAFTEVVGYGQLTMKEITVELAKEVLKVEDHVEEVDIDDLEIDWGTTYISKEPTSAQAFKYYKAILDAGGSGICVSRVHPDKLVKKYKMKNENLYWLSKTSGQDSMSPTNISKMAHVLNQFIKNNNHSVIILDGLEYLISNNDFKLVMRFLDDINEHVVVGHCILILPITESTYSTKELTLLERNTVHLKDEMIKHVGILFKDQEEKTEEPKENLAEMQKKQTEILEHITKIQERINTAKSLGLEVDQFDEGLKEIRELSNTKEYDGAITKAKALKKDVNSSIEGSLDKVSDIIERSKDTLKQAEELMVKTEEMDSLLNQAIGAFRLNMFEEALQYANQMLEKADEPISYRITVNLLKEAKDKITKAKEGGADTTDAEELLKSAKPHILAKEYPSAQEFAQKAIDAADALIGGKTTPNDAVVEKNKDDTSAEDKTPPEDQTTSEGTSAKDEVPEDEEKNPRCPDCNTLLLKKSKFCNQCGKEL